MKYLTIYENFNKITFEISKNDYDEIFSKCCEGITLGKDIPIIRSLNSELTEDYYLIDPRKYERTSANTKNYYTLIMDNELEWRKFPKRKHGVICSLNDSYMGNEFRVVPLLKWDNILIKYGIEEFTVPKWGICSNTDIWNSFSLLNEIGFNADEFNSLIEKIANTLDIEINNFKDLKSEFIKLTIDKLKEIKINSKWTDIQRHFMKLVSSTIYLMEEKNIDNMYDFIRTVYSPNGFKVMTYQEIQKNYNIKNQNEIWTDKPLFYLNISKDY